MLDRLPEYIDPLHLADKRGELKGRLSLSNLDRLAEKLHNDTGIIAVDLFFSREGRLAKIEGTIEGTLQLECQNCLQAVEWPVNVAVKLGIVTSIDQANRLPEDYEPLIIDEEKILLKDLVEDELLLALPTFAKHQYKCFVPVAGHNTDDLLSGDVQSPPENPFSILAKLKNIGDLNGRTKK